MSAIDVVTTLAASRKAVQLYPQTHPSFIEAVDGLIAAADEATVSGSFQLNIHEGRLYQESTVLPDDVPGAASIAEAFESRHIESLTIHPGFTRSDAIGLIEVLSLRPSPDMDIEAELGSRNVQSVTVSFLDEEDDEEKAERERQREADRAMYTRLISTLRNLTNQLSAGGGVDLSSASGLVGNIMSRFLEDQSAVLSLATIRGASERSLFHSLNVMIYTIALGQALGIPEEGLASLGMCAMLHDVGKAAFDVDDPAQAQAMQAMHPKIGAEIIQRLGHEDPAPMLVAYEHHMYIDGSGYPERPGDYIAHPYSRMVALADRYENLTNPGDGESPLTPDKAIVQVLREAGTLFDPFFARLFAKALGVFPIGCMVRLSDQSVGVVCGQGEDPLAPVVRMVYDEAGQEFEEYVELDLTEGELRIVEVFHPENLNTEVANHL